VDKKPLERIWSGIAGFSRRVADGVAHLTTWQFILLCFLGLVGAGILESILDSSPRTRHIPRVAVSVDKGSPKTIIKGTGPDNAEPKQPSGDSVIGSIKDEILTEIQKEIDSESDAADTTSANSKKSKKSLTVQIEGIDPKNIAEATVRRLPLAQIVFFLIIILLAVRIATRSRLRAEKLVLSAEASAEMESLRRQVAEAQLQTLQAQVEPHFLFNTLAAVEHLTGTDAPRAAIMLRHLIAFLRGSLPNMREQSTSLGREVDLCQSYLAIMQIRMEDRLMVSINVPESLRGLSFPPMMLQSLVENSIKHGLEPKPAGGAIAISARLQDGRLRVTVADTGLGIAENAPQGIGLGNIRDRLKRLYGNSAALVLAPNAPAGAHITIEIPHVPPRASDTGR
jgi:Histidine kinase